MAVASCNQNNTFWKLNIIFIKIQINRIKIYDHMLYYTEKNKYNGNSKLVNSKLVVHNNTNDQSTIKIKLKPKCKYLYSVQSLLY